MNIASELRKILGDTYGGPSLSYRADVKTFVIYMWSDAPVRDDVLAEGTSLSEVIEKYKNYLKAQSRRKS